MLSLPTSKRVANPLTPTEAWREIGKYHRSETIRKIYLNERLIPTLTSSLKFVNDGPREKVKQLERVKLEAEMRQGYLENKFDQAKLNQD
ncbi:hypothetical protein CMK14_19850 [Candidatus Poribacteria bacterium]|nr:hypothetical protein [Candidatus Poribacteria bacterium]